MTGSVVWAREIDGAAEGETPFAWLFGTNVPVTRFEEAGDPVRWYRVRGPIEVFHQVLKSGGPVEDCRREDASGLSRELTRKRVVAWRLFGLVQIHRAQPDAPCPGGLAAYEWQAFYAAIHRTSGLPAAVPTVRQVVRWIAQLGGFWGRNGEGEPGVTGMWRGWQRLHDLATMGVGIHGEPST
jgi:hypothetical protein